MPRSTTLLIATAFSVASSIFGAPGFAQSSAPVETPAQPAVPAPAADVPSASMPEPGSGAGPLTVPAEIRYCLCAQAAVETLDARVAAATKNNQEAQDRLAALDKQLAESKANVDVNQPEQVDAYRRLVETRERAAAEFNNDLQPHLQQLVTRYNAQTERYNASCTSRGMDQATLETVKADLSCPTEP